MNDVQADIDLLESLTHFQFQIEQFTKYVETVKNPELTKRWLALGGAWVDWMERTRKDRLGTV